MTEETLTPNLKMVLFIGAFSSLLLFVGKTVGGGTGVQIALLCALVVSAGAYLFSDKLIFKLLNAKSIISDDQPLLFATVAYLAEKADIPAPRIYLIHHKFPNAFSTGRNPENAAVIVTTGLLSALEKNELAGVIAHELAHIIHRDTQLTTLTAGVGACVSALANMVQVVAYLGARTPSTQPNWIGKLIMGMVAPPIAILIHLAVSRAREYHADAKAVELCGNSMWLANALYKIERAKERHELKTVEENPALALLFIINPLHNKQWSMLFGIHPPTQERINRLEILA